MPRAKIWNLPILGMAAATGVPSMTHDQRNDSRELHQQLRNLKQNQIERFEALKKKFASYLSEASVGDISPYLSEPWFTHHDRLLRDFVPHPPLDFIRHPSILFTMFVPERFLTPGLSYLASRPDSSAMAALIEEDPIGTPILSAGHDGSYVTSSNSVHHLCHLRRFSQATGVALEDFRTVVEWGGGYGNLAKIFRRAQSQSATYIIIDMPVFNCLQWLYLASIFGEKEVQLLLHPDDRIIESRINLVPVWMAEDLMTRADLFISTWALNESSTQAQRAVVERNWYGAPHLLLGMHHGEELEQVALWQGARSEIIGEHMSGQRYIFR